MTPPGLLCNVCNGRLRGHLARRNRDHHGHVNGWRHAHACSSPEALTEGRWVQRGGVKRWEAA